ncbi:MAG TPA: SDR family oxidoreductase [Candidatus Deferrimicrobiaceae bacterium]|jgi:3-oxoacyl-[acyl-carrier protein] reductase|nr:SDR family oxidoreductase [Candidatus Deferrimicrobiaceae bacterium]
MKPAGPKLSGKVVLVTGGATGIGRATVLALAREGAAVAVNYARSKAAAHETAKLAEQAGVRALPVRADVTRDAEVRAMVDEVARELGGLDGLVNNAGWTQRVPHRQLEDLTDEIWERALATNLRGPFYCARAAVPHMERRGGGAIVNITSVAAFTGTGSSMAYAASKAGLDALTKSLARALAPSRIRVNAVAPGLLATGFGGGLITPDVLAQIGRLTPIGRPVTVEEAADAVVFLLGNEALTGYTSIVDGGLTALGPTSPLS